MGLTLTPFFCNANIFCKCFTEIYLTGSKTNRRLVKKVCIKIVLKSWFSINLALRENRSALKSPICQKSSLRSKANVKVQNQSFDFLFYLKYNLMLKIKKLIFKLSFRFVAAYFTALLEFFFHELSNLVTQTHAMSKVYRVTDPDTDSVKSFVLFFYLTDLTPA